ncbi:unnamed protein product [Medioppia subpectinata]|uniref:Uncharacterized protein n=1 Tax=Medioppia subpectinata TaxID=1979941 RepID=A0A7R9KTW0_9ACAR|nr:unnamed protein product [Medioppia subpectinata]CAG2109743.1 unnamed protein product [Medioppia subpectinata]
MRIELLTIHVRKPDLKLTISLYIMPIYKINNDGYNDYMLAIDIPDSVETIKDLKSFLLTKGLYNENTHSIGLKCLSMDSSNKSYMLFDDDHKLDSYWRDNAFEILIWAKLDAQSLWYGPSKESEENITQLCEEMSALKASNESEVKALKAQLKTSNDSMEAMEKGIYDLNQSNQQMVTDLSEVLALKTQLKTSKDSMDTQIKDLRQQLCDQKLVGFSEEFNASNESEANPLKAQLKTAMDSIETITEEINDLREKDQTVATDVNELDIIVITVITLFITCLLYADYYVWKTISGLSDGLRALKGSKLIIESDVKQLAQQMNAQNIRCSASDSSSSTSSIGSHNQLTTNSDKISDDIYIRETFKKIENQIKTQYQMTYTLLKALVIENGLSLKALEDIRQLTEDSEDSESMTCVDQK